MPSSDPEKIRAKERRRYERHREELLAKSRARYRAAHPAKEKVRVDPEEVRERKKAYLKVWRETHPDYYKAWLKAHPGYQEEYRARRWLERRELPKEWREGAILLDGVRRELGRRKP